MKILINAVNVTAAGPKAIATSLLPPLLLNDAGSQFVILLPNHQDYATLRLPTNGVVHHLPVNRGLMNDIHRLQQLYWGISRLANQIRPQICLTLGDLGVVGLPCPEVVYLHQPYLVYDPDEIGGSFWSSYKRWYIKKHFAWTVSRAARIIVQTDVMAERLSKRYPIPERNIVKIPPPVPQHVIVGQEKNGQHNAIATMSSCPKPIKLLFLSGYYGHKNHAVLPAVAQELRRRNLASQVQIFTTISQDLSGTAMIRSELRQYSDVVTNLGYLPQQLVKAAFNLATALFLPTLAESYGLIYIESMQCGVPILTSDRDFARWMCREWAIYFEPTDPQSIVDAIERLPRWISQRCQDYEAFIHLRLAELPRNWDEVSQQFLTVLHECSTESID